MVVGVCFKKKNTTGTILFVAVSYICTTEAISSMCEKVVQRTREKKMSDRFYTIVFYACCVLAIAGLCLCGYAVFLTPNREVKNETSNESGDEPITEPTAGSVEPETLSIISEQITTTHNTAPADYLQTITKCDISVVGVKRGNSLCFESPDGLSYYVCLTDIVRDQGLLLSNHDGLDFACTTMFQLRKPNDTLPCICSVRFPGRDGYYTIVQPHVVEVSAETDTLVTQDGLLARLPLTLSIENQYSEHDHATITFQGSEVPRMAKVLQSIGINVYQNV